MKILLHNQIAPIIFAAPGDMADKLNELLNAFWQPAVAIIISLSSLWAIYLGVKVMRAGDERKKEAAKSAVIHFFAGIILIFIIVVLTPMLILYLQEWQLGK